MILDFLVYTLGDTHPHSDNNKITKKEAKDKLLQVPLLFIKY